jgi:transcriptional regulator with XRE-family HTH domain
MRKQRDHWILDLIRQLGITQRELARRLGCSETRVCHWVTDRYGPGPMYKRKLIELEQSVFRTGEGKTFP